MRWLGPRLARQEDPAWPFAPAADVLCADMAFVSAPETDRGWDLRWVEFQTFTSLVSTMYTLHVAATDVWPELGELRFWSPLPGNDWLSSARGWMAPAHGSILLENAPWSQPTRTDFEAARHWFGVEVTGPQSLRAQSRRLEFRDSNGRWRPVPHVANRLILHEAKNRAEVESLLSSVWTGWNSHPVWYYRIDKSLLPVLPLPPAEKCAYGNRWRELNLAPDALVAKARHSHSGKGVMLNATAEILDNLENSENWIVQPKFSPAPLTTARDGAPLFGEIRSVVALSEIGNPWTVCRLVRLSREPMLSTSRWSGAPGEGAVPLYAPPNG